MLHPQVKETFKVHQYYPSVFLTPRLILCIPSKSSCRDELSDIPFAKERQKGSAFHQ